MIIIGLILVVAVAAYFYVNDAADVASEGDVLGNVETNTTVPDTTVSEVNVPKENIPTQTNTPAQVETPRQVESVQQNTVTQTETTPLPEQNTTTETPVETQQTTDSQATEEASDQVRDSAEEGNTTGEAQASEPDPEPNETSTEANNGTTDGVNVYFAKKTNRYIKAGESTYTFHGNNTITNSNRERIAKIILGRTELPENRYAFLKTIESALIRQNYRENDTVTFDIYEIKKEYPKINKANIGSVVYIVGETMNMDGETVTIEIKEKENLLANGTLPVLEVTGEGKDEETGSEITSFQITPQDNKLVKKIKLQPQGYDNLKNWIEKLSEENKKEYLWLKADKGEKTEFLKEEGKYFEAIKRAPWMIVAIDEMKKAAGVLEGTEPMYSMAKSYLRYVGNPFEPTDSQNGPWCAAYMNWCMNEAKYNHVVTGGASSLAPIANDGLDAFKKIDDPIYGCIVVYKHTSRWKGHTGFLYGTTSGGKYILLGGNQTNTIRFQDYDKDALSSGSLKKFYGFYIPKDYTVTESDKLTSDDENLSVSALNNEFGVTGDGSNTVT